MYIDDNLSQILKAKNLTDEYRHFSFHHLGIASENLEEAVDEYKEGEYNTEDSCLDNSTGVRRQFLIHHNMPRLEILQNLPNSRVLDIYLKNFMKVFHCGYLTDDFEYCLNLLINKLNSKRLSQIKYSEYFEGKCCYILLPDKSIVEIIESKSQC